MLQGEPDLSRAAKDGTYVGADRTLTTAMCCYAVKPIFGVVRRAPMSATTGSAVLLFRCLVDDPRVLATGCRIARVASELNRH